ncbi:hypothetical protein BaRGS_00020029 [Batillaria attramentaria]|uniref:Uncharacterized protein n=1 Tax=Batillaria attramentaria TaxID=370345 RepID=A0ABD0KNG1_9CAEN
MAHVMSRLMCGDSDRRPRVVIDQSPSCAPKVAHELYVHVGIDQRPRDTLDINFVAAGRHGIRGGVTRLCPETMRNE